MPGLSENASGLSLPISSLFALVWRGLIKLEQILVCKQTWAVIFTLCWVMTSVVIILTESFTKTYCRFTNSSSIKQTAGFPGQCRTS